MINIFKKKSPIVITNFRVINLTADFSKFHQTNQIKFQQKERCFKSLSYKPGTEVELNENNHFCGFDFV